MGPPPPKLGPPKPLVPDPIMIDLSLALMASELSDLKTSMYLIVVRRLISIVRVQYTVGKILGKVHPTALFSWFYSPAF